MDERTKSGVMLMAAAALLYASSRLAVFALTRADGSDAGRRALAQWLPIAATAIAAIFFRRADIAVAVIFGTSVACPSLVLGLAAYVAPIQSLPASRKVWPFVLPAALLPLIAGFSAHLTWFHAMMFLAFGGAIFLVWRESPEGPDNILENHPPASFAFPIVLGAIVMAGVGAALAVAGTIASGSSSRFTPGGTLAATVLSALLVLPTLGTTSAVAQRGQPGRALSALVGTVLLNLCLLLPVAILLWYPLSTTLGQPLHFHFPHFRELKLPWKDAHPLPYDLVAWRIETVIVVVLGFGLVPVSMGKLVIGRAESILLVAGYAAYVVAVVVLDLQIVW